MFMEILRLQKIEESIQTVEENIVVDNLTSLIKDKNTHKVFFSFYIVDKANLTRYHNTLET